MMDSSTDEHGRNGEGVWCFAGPPVLRASGDCTGPLGGLHRPARGDCTGPLGGIALARSGGLHRPARGDSAGLRRVACSRMIGWNPRQGRHGGKDTHAHIGAPHSDCTREERIRCVPAERGSQGTTPWTPLSCGSERRGSRPASGTDERVRGNPSRESPGSHRRY